MRSCRSGSRRPSASTRAGTAWPTSARPSRSAAARSSTSRWRAWAAWRRRAPSRPSARSTGFRAGWAACWRARSAAPSASSSRRCRTSPIPRTSSRRRTSMPTTSASRRSSSAAAARSPPHACPASPRSRIPTCSRGGRSSTPRSVRRRDGSRRRLQHGSHEPAVDEHRGAGDVAGPARGEERDEVGHLLGLADTSHRGLGRSLREPRLHGDADLPGARRDVGQHALGEDRARTHVVHEDAVASDFVREALREGHHAHARGAGEREVRDRLIDGAREDVDDATAAGLLQMGHGLPRHPREEQQRALHRGGPLLLGGGVGASQRRPAGVVDEDVQAAESADGGGHEVTDGLGAVQIARERQDVGARGVANLLRRRVQVLLRAAAQRQRGPLFGEHLRARPAQPLARAADDRDLAPELQIHGALLYRGVMIAATQGHRLMALLSVRDLSVAFETRDGLVRAVNDVTFALDAGKVLALLGESGSGKSVTLRAILGLHPAVRTRVTGEVLLKGRDVNRLDEAARERLRGGVVSMVFQEPMTALDPVYTIGEQIVETLVQHRGLDRRGASRRARELLDLVQVPSPERCLASYPHEISGGMRQRAMIAIALACDPELLLADEPTTALDVTVQAQILWLLRDLQQRLGLAVIFVTHDLGVAAEIADAAAVMYAGRIVEQAPIRDLFRRPAHPYTEGLMQATVRRGQKGRALVPIPGAPPNLVALPAGCAFAPRCPYVKPVCIDTLPPLHAVAAGHVARCHLVPERFAPALAAMSKGGLS